MKQLASSTQDTPLGPFTTIADDGVLLASGWTGDIARLLRYIHPSLRPQFDTQVRAYDDLGEISKAVAAFHEGDLSAPDRIPVRQHGSAFMTAAWQQLRTIPAGSTVSYREYAALAGKPAAVRAAASSCARNAAALFVPCHRVIRTDGTLGGFGYGLDIKRWLLDHETAS
ncbi:MAG: methylated-DNA--protein-cysteine methyltransferase [Acidimicrobiales bacterium]|nr:MAG: methylated-DNA--protein-cysteine methyltransferase [Acidimicrobiales bacterium]